MFQSLKHWLKLKETKEPVKHGKKENTGDTNVGHNTTFEDSSKGHHSLEGTGGETKSHINDHSKDRDRLNRLQNLIGSPINPNEETIFLRCLRHRSLTDLKSFRSHETYERLEFLGDAVLELIVSELIYEIYPEEDEGFLTKFRAKIVRGKTLALLGEKLGLHELAEISASSGAGRKHISQGIMADLFESLVAALYLTKGFEPTRVFVREAVQKYLNLDQLSKKIDNFKSLLMEYLQAAQRPLPVYRVTKESGPDHQKIFTIGVFLEGKLMGEASGKSKKEAEQRAAQVALGALKRQEG